MFPERRMRRVRSRNVQPLLCETTLTKNDLVAPLFVDETIKAPKPIESMPGQFRYPVDGIAGIAGKMWERGIRAVLLFGIPSHKDDAATSAYDTDGIVQQAVRRVKAAYPGMVVITDVCACEYTSHGHCGIVGGTRCGEKDLLNDESLLLMNRIAISHAEAGADIVAPSCMLDGMVTRSGLRWTTKDTRTCSSCRTRPNSRLPCTARSGRPQNPGSRLATGAPTR